MIVNQIKQGAVTESLIVLRTRKELLDRAIRSLEKYSKTSEKKVARLPLS
jgi:hypothetical protein